MDLVVRSNALHYQDICEALSNTQLNLLFAILEGETKLTSAETMQNYRLGTPRNVSKNKKVLEEKDMVEIHGDSITFNDQISNKSSFQNHKLSDPFIAFTFQHHMVYAFLELVHREPDLVLPDVLIARGEMTSAIGTIDS